MTQMFGVSFSVRLIRIHFGELVVLLTVFSFTAALLFVHRSKGEESNLNRLCH
jgi:hypothetical protein